MLKYKYLHRLAREFSIIGNIFLFPSMARLVLMFFLFLLLGNVQSRFLNLGSEELVSDGVDGLDRKFLPFFSLSSLYSSSDTCYHYYGFLPCADNIPGYIFQIVALEYLLYVGDQVLTRGSTKLFSIYGVGLYGAIIFRILMVLPVLGLTLASGLVRSKEDTQSYVESGVASVAGSTVFCLTFQWGLCVILGKTDMTGRSTPQEPKTSTAGCLLIKQKISSLVDYGIEIDEETRYTAGIMLLSLIPFVIVQLATIPSLQPWNNVMLSVTLAVTIVALFCYFVHQSCNKWIQERSLEYFQHELLLAGFLGHMNKCAPKRLVNEEGRFDHSAIKSLFHAFDKDGDQSISPSEVKALLEEMKWGNSQLIEDFAIKDFFKSMDDNGDRVISADEFLTGVKRFFNEAQQIVSDGKACSRDCLLALQQVVDNRKAELAKIEMLLPKVLIDAKIQVFSCFLTNGKPDADKIQSIFEEFDKNKDRKMTTQELKEMLASKINHVELDPNDVAAKMMKAFDNNEDHELDVNEFTNGFRNWLSPDNDLHPADEPLETKFQWNYWKAIFQVILGIAIVSSLLMPLLADVRYLSSDIGIPSFYISFVVLPLAKNFRTTIEAVAAISQKKERTSSITFSEIYEGVVMNNLVGLLSMIAIICGKGFTWDYSAEVLVVLAVSALVGFLAFLCSTYPLWTSILAFSLYPLSLVAYGVLHYVLNWN